MSKSKSNGFTLVELLVVIAIIGLLSTLAIVSLGSARAKARDARRISDIRQLQTAVELYHADQGFYPIEDSTAITLGIADQTDILTNTGFESSSSPTGTVTYMGIVPGNLDIPTTIADYQYTTDASGFDYLISFELEGNVAGLTGSLEASSVGIKAP
jgi:prepilin-type N-terminal cleavage/methylation domain-containing protein